MPSSKYSRPKSSAPEAARVSTRDEAAIVEAAWLYYHDGLNQNSIAERMRISRASVVNYLSHAREEGWIRLYLDSDVFGGHRLAEELCRAYGLQKTLVVPGSGGGQQMRLRVTRAAADWLPRLLEPGDRLGVSWGETVYQMVQQLAPQPMEDLTVVQLLGSRPAARGFAAEACTSLLAQRLSGELVNLHVPLLLSRREVRDALVAEPEVAAQIEALSGCNKTILACGTLDEDAHVVRTAILERESVARFREMGAVGVVCGRLIDSEGAPVVAPVEDRMIGVSLEQMRGKKMSLLLAAGADRAVPARAAIKGGYVTHLVTSGQIAEELLDLA
ncbi:MAG: sugar-binding transcriptional regulator [Epibacterium sp.]|nr:sugar-binding transcriptional regulator [Epibacterium sp.]NQX75219.1 sugar-binding transcriptional regulator [Epibacterium sp.]